jgi:hypothetical protein
MLRLAVGFVARLGRAPSEGTAEVAPSTQTSYPRPGSGFLVLSIPPPRRAVEFAQGQRSKNGFKVDWPGAFEAWASPLGHMVSDVVEVACCTGSVALAEHPYQATGLPAEARFV